MSDTFEDFADVLPGQEIVIRTTTGTTLIGVVAKIDPEKREIEFTHGVGYTFAPASWGREPVPPMPPVEEVTP